MISDFSDGIKSKWQVSFGGEDVEDIVFGNIAGTYKIMVEGDGSLNFEAATWIYGGGTIGLENMLEDNVRVDDAGSGRDRGRRSNQ